MVLGSTQPLTELSTWNVSLGGGSKGGRYVGEPSHLHVQTVLKSSILNLEPSGPE